ncbi:MAG: hypothetical protein ABSC22_05385 [Roseiarcus sp.]|jgi:hypothetical protein
MTELKPNILGAAAQLLDPYGRQARLFPALLVILPAVSLILVWFPALWSILGALVSLASSFGLILLLSQIARDRGKRLEPELYKSWGGKPSVALLRHSDERIDEHTKARYRTFLQEKLPQLPLPTPEEELANPTAADRAYESVTAWLLTQTRDTKKFSILFRENISYGFRRNLWGLKPLGVTTAVVTAGISTVAAGYLSFVESAAPRPEIVVVTIVAWLFSIFWIVVVNSDWVRLPADAYGMQLLAACDTLNSKGVAKPRKGKQQV